MHEANTHPAAGSMIHVEGITKTYGATIAVDNVSFQAGKGEIVGFLGPNGAGKSTTIKILTCYIVADSGRVTVGGHDVLEQPLAVRQSIGYLPENTPIYSDMRVLDYLKFIGRIRKVPAAKLAPRLEEVIDLTGIRPMVMKNIGHLSRGFRQRVGLAQAILHDPPILILDEPTSGLDPHQIIEIRQLIRRLGETKLVLFSSHILQEVSSICSRILVIKNGKLIVDGVPADLVRQSKGGSMFTLRIQGPLNELQGRLSKFEGVREVRHLRNLDGYQEFKIQTANGKDLGPELFRLAKEQGWTLSRLEEAERTLEDVYLELTAAR